MDNSVDDLGMVLQKLEQLSTIERFEFEKFAFEEDSDFFLVFVWIG
jgi:hypothetical protein